MIYAMQATDGGPVKIGTSIDVDGRREELERCYGRPLAVLATFPGGRVEERAIHKRFSHLRLGRTEQFRPASDLMAFLGHPLLVDPNPDAVEAMPGGAGFALKASEEWMEWLREGAKAVGLSMASLLEQAVREYARSEGFDKPPPRRR